MQVKISADSTCDLSMELREQNDITIVPLYVVREEQALRDEVEITPEDIFAHVARTGKLCKTAAVNIEDYVELFTQLRQTYDAVVHFSISSEMSCCYQNACIAAQEVGGVYVVDSRSLSTGIGHLVLDAAQMAREGAGGAEIKAAMDEKKEKLDVSFVVDTLEYLHKGGRCSTIAAMGANLLHLKPCIEVKNGAMGVGKKYRGSLERVLVQYVQERLADAENIDQTRIFITDSGVNDEIYAAVHAAVSAVLPAAQIYHTRAGSTISCHCGPNCLGILFYRK